MRYGRCGKEIRLTTTHAPHVSETASTKGHKSQNEFNLKFMLFVSPTHTVCGWGNNYWRLFWYCYVLFLQQYNLFTSCNYFLYAIILIVSGSVPYNHGLFFSFTPTGIGRKLYSFFLINISLYCSVFYSRIKAVWYSTNRPHKSNTLDLQAFLWQGISFKYCREQHKFKMKLPMAW